MIIINLTHDPCSTRPNILVKVDPIDSTFGYRDAENVIASLIKNILSSMDPSFFHKPPAEVNYFKVDRKRPVLLDNSESVTISEEELSLSAGALKDGSADLVLKEREFVNNLTALCDEKFSTKILSVHYFINAEKMENKTDAPISTRALVDGIDNNMLQEGAHIIDLISQYLSSKLHITVNRQNSFEVLPNGLVKLPIDMIKENSPTKPGDPPA